ncbi:histidine phosphatase family protein [Pseudonocardia spinosispora]|uniref:histidine phosphatase family protein n=1 Tax=Pseudonocardia spinosispora TaxID=103441 RepID=UPI000410D220|nr:histidine phosphatase family protein [Pseudonocardia spinosispora]
MSDSEQTHGRIYLLRHGETAWSATGRHTSYTDITLTERGRQLATSAGRLLTEVRGPDSPPFALALTSPRRRATDTAKLAQLSPTIDEQLVEWNYGAYEGLTTPEIRRSDPGWTVWTHSSPGGESAEQVAERADTVLERCRAVLSKGDVALIGHGHFSRVLTARWLNLPATAGVGFKLDAGGLTVLGDERGAPRLDHVNLVDPR